MSVLRTQIRVKCSDVAAGALAVDWAALDLDPDFSLRMSKDVEALSDINNILTDGVLPFSVPFSTTNDLVLGRFGSPVILDPSGTGIEARAHVDGHELPFDTIFHRTKDNSRKAWEQEFRRSPNHWLELASDKKLCTIELGSETFNTANAEAGWAQPAFDAAGAVTSVARLWPVDYGGWVDLSEPPQFTDPPIKSVWVEDLRYLFSVPELLRLGFCEIGWTLQGLIFETVWAKSLWAYILKRDYYTESRGGTAILVLSNNEATPITEGVSGVGNYLVTNVVDYDPGTNAEAITTSPGYYWSGFTNPLPFKANFSFCFSGTILNPSATLGAEIFLSVWEIDFATEVIPFNQLAPYESIGLLEATESKSFTACVTATLDPGQGAFLVASAIFEGFNLQSPSIEPQTGFRVTIKPDTQSLIRGDVPDLKRLIDCDYYLLDLFKGLVHLVNGRIETDWNNRTLTVYPQQTADVFGDSTPGFIDESDIEDLRGRVVCDSIRLSPVKNDLKRYTRLQFADSTDAYIDELDPLEPPYSRKILNGIELPDQIDERANPFFEPTLERQSDVLRQAVDFSSFPLPAGLAVHDRPYLPVMTDNLDGARSFNILPRILFAYGVVGQVGTSTISGGKTGLYFEGAAVTEIGYASQARTLELNPTFPPDIDGSVVFGTLPSDLFVTFYLGFSQVAKRGTWVDLLVLMNMNDWQRWNFRKRFLFEYEGRQIIAAGQNIRDFAPATDLPTPMRFLVEPNVSGCCDGPCSCRYSECDYFQDFGQYLSQTTLDSLSLTSFKIDSVEQLDAPVEFGIINTVSINGRTFVTNLVDTLNELELPYFSFNPSQRDYPEKDDWRYFKIKRPACQTFEIIISDGGGEVYKYTDTETLQKWFDVSWTPFGYVSNQIGTPQGCVITVEY